MGGYRPGRVVSVLTKVLSIAYVGLLVGALLVLVGAPALKLLGDIDTDWVWGVPVPVAVQDTDAAVATWGDTRIEVDDVRASLRLPIAALPWSIFAVLWTHAAAAFALLLLFLRDLRTICHRAREGNPFHTDNGRLLRRLGFLLIALALLNGVASTITAVAVRGSVSSDMISVPAGLSIDLRLVLFGLVLLALSEIFRHGAALETEQSLVV